MSADNFLYVKRDGTVWMGFASDEREPDSYGQPHYQGTDFRDAMDWAHRYCAEEIVEYGVTCEPQSDEGKRAQRIMAHWIAELLHTYPMRSPDIEVGSVDENMLRLHNARHSFVVTVEEVSTSS